MGGVVQAQGERQQRHRGHEASLDVSLPQYSRLADIHCYSRAMNRRLPLVHALVVIGIVLVLHEGWTGGLIGGGFHPGHAWVVDQVAR